MRFYSHAGCAVQIRLGRESARVKQVGAPKLTEAELDRITISIPEQLFCRNVKQIRGGLVFKPHERVYYSSLGSKVITKKKSITTLNAEATLGLNKTGLVRKHVCSSSLCFSTAVQDLY